MEENKLAVAILGIVVVIAIIGLLFMFSAAKSGGVVYGSYVTPKIYTNYKQEPFPYARQAEPRYMVEYPAGTISGEQPGAPTYAGASQFFITGTEKGVQSTLGTAYSSYGRSAETHVPTAQTTGVGIEFPGGVKANYCYGTRVYYTKAADPTRTCFTEDRYGRKVSDLLPQYYGCCDS
ncbi:MAG: hypothetical protein QW666_02680 [Candidatus Woesearchaeota archaeon]